MPSNTLWLNTHFNCIYPFRQADVNGEFRIVTSSHTSKYPEVMLADSFELEPFEADKDYVEYALGFVKRYGVTVFMPGRKLDEIARRLSEFTALGVKVILAGDLKTIQTLDDKGVFFETIGPALVPIPDYVVAPDLKAFSQGVYALQKKHTLICFKPTIGIFGFGFKVLNNGYNSSWQGQVDEKLVVELPEALRFLQERKRFKEQMVMEYLPGVERSVDCLALNGELLRSVVRHKLNDGSRLLEKNPEVEEYARRLTRVFNLSGIFNVQFKEDKSGLPRLLEINARMSGGISMACLSGLVFPYWAAKLALNPDCAGDIPSPKVGLRVAELAQAVIVG